MRLAALATGAPMPAGSKGRPPPPSAEATASRTSSSDARHPTRVSLEIVVQSLVSGLLMGLVYALIAAGLSLIFGLMEIVNFAHGEFLMVALYVAFFGWTLARLDPLVSLPLTAAVLAVLGWATYH